MQLDVIPPRVRRAILRAFQVRWPTVHEVAQITDRPWLATPDLGPCALEKIHGILHPQQSQGETSSPRWTDAELLDRLESIQGKLRRIHRALEARMGEASPMRLQARGRVGIRPEGESSHRGDRHPSQGLDVSATRT